MIDRRFKRITRSQLQKCIDDSMTIDGAASHLKVSTSVIVGRCRRYKMSFAKPSRWDLDKYTKLRASGMAEKDISVEMGMSLCSLNVQKNKLGIQNRLNEREQNFLNSEKLPLVEKYLKEGHSPGRVCSMLKDDAITEYYIQTHMPELTAYKSRHKHSVTGFSSEFSEYVPCPKQYKMTAFQKEAYWGMAVGDSHIPLTGYMRLGHGITQLQYMKAKHHILSPLSGLARLGDRVNQPVIYFDLAVSEEQKEILSIAYPNGKRNIFSSDVWKNLTLISFVFWFLDDGKHSGNKHYITLGNNNKGCDYGNIPEFCRQIYSSIGIALSYKKDNYSGYLEIGSVPEEFITLINKFCTKDLSYKMGSWAKKNLELGYGYKDLFYDWDRRRERCLDEVRKQCGQFITTPQEFRTSGQEAQEDFLDKCVAYYRKKGFPYPSISESRNIALLESFNKNGFAKIENSRILSGPSGVVFCNQFFPHIFEGRRKNGKSPVEVFESDSLRDVIRELLMCSQRGLTNPRLLALLKRNSNPVYNFKPTVARMLYDKYAHKGVVYDFSSGYGARVLGAMSAGVAKYIGVDLNNKTVNGNIKLADTVKNLHPAMSTEVQIIHSGSENYVPTIPIDFAFSSPPYYDLEEYSPATNKGLEAYDGYYKWIDVYFKNTLENILSALKPKGRIGINISKMLEKDVNYIFTNHFGMVLEDRYEMRFSSLYHKEFFEPILIYKRNEPSDKLF